MNANEATTNMVVALINIKGLTRPEDVAEAYKTIHKVVEDPYEA